MKFPELANPQKVGQWLSGDRERGELELTANRYEASFWGDGSILEAGSIMVVQHNEYTKIHGTVHVK